MRAAFEGNLQQVKSQLRSGANPNTLRNGATPLSLAAARGHTAIVQQLLASGALVNARNSAGWTPLMIATKNRHQSIIKVLLQNGANQAPAIGIAEEVGLAHLFDAAGKKTVVPAEPAKSREPVRQPDPGEQRQREIKRLVALARRQVASRKLTKPRNDNAYATVKQVLRLEPRNREAQRILRAISAQYQKLATQQKNRGNFQRSLANIDAGLRVTPSYAPLLALRLEVQKRMARQAEQVASETSSEQQAADESAEDRRQRLKAENIARLEAQAERQIRARALTSPSSSNALKTYREILALDPDHAAAKQGLGKIAEIYLDWAGNDRDKGNLESSLAFIDKGLNVVADHDGLLAARRSVNELLQQRDRQRQLDRLLAAAEDALQAQRLIPPEVDNAYDIARQIDSLDSSNAQASDLRGRIGIALQGRARELLTQGEFDGSEQLVARAVELIGEDPAWTSLQAALKQAKAAHDSRQREQLAQRRQLAALQDRAEQQFGAGKLAEPDGDNAHETWRALLELDPRNAAALEGLQQIAARLEDQARRSLAADRLDPAGRLIEQGLEVQPAHEGLLSLQQRHGQRVARQQRERQEMQARSQQITGLLARAEQQMAAGELAQPADNSALASYRTVLTLDPNNQQAVSGLDRVADGLRQAASDSLAAGELEQSHALIESGLDIVPGDGKLLALLDEVESRVLQREQAQREQRARTQKINQLLARARYSLQAGNLVEPADDNAHRSYRQVLEIDAANTEALAGIANIAGKLEQFANEHRQRDELEEALSVAEQALQVQPGNQDMLALRAELTDRLAEIERERQARLERQRVIDRHLTDGASRLQQGSLIEPAETSALTSYRAVLELEPDNAAATEGIDRIVEQLEQMAKSRQQAGELGNALSLVRQALAIKPAKPTLATLDTQLQKQMAEVERRRQQALDRQRQIKRLLAEANERFEQNELIEPAEKNAYQSFQQVLEFDSENKQAAAGIQRVLAKIEELAREKIRNGELAPADRLLAAAEQLAPTHALSSLRNTIRAETAKVEQARIEQQRQRQLAELEKIVAEQLQKLSRLEAATLKTETAMRNSIQQALQQNWQTE